MGFGTRTPSKGGNSMGRSIQDRREIPCGTGFNPDRTTGPSLNDTRTPWDAHREPINDYQALMDTDFDEEPATLHDSKLLEFCESVLDEREKAVIGFRVYGGMSLAQAGRYLGAEFPRNGVPRPYSKQTVSNLEQSAIVKMRKHLLGGSDDNFEPVP